VIFIVSRHTWFPEHALWLTEFVQRYSTRMYTQYILGAMQLSTWQSI